MTAPVVLTGCSSGQVEAAGAEGSAVGEGGTRVLQDLRGEVEVPEDPERVVVPAAIRTVLDDVERTLLDG